MTTREPEYLDDAHRDPRADLAPERDTMVLHEQRLVGSTERVEYARGVVRTRVVTETVNVPVQVQREELVVEGLDGEVLSVVDRVTDESARAGAGAAPGGADRDGHTNGRDERPTEGEEIARLVLHAQRPVVTFETVPVEEVIVRKVVTTREARVTDTVAREEVELLQEGRDEPRPVDEQR